MQTLAFDVAAAHRHFSTHCFNRAWDLIEKTNRNADEDRLMVALNQASLYHWQQRPDCTDENLSVGYWQASRIQTLLGNAAEARRLAEACLSCSDALPPFYVGYAYEALARAESLAGNMAQRDQFLARAWSLAQKLQDSHDRDQLVADLATI